MPKPDFPKDFLWGASSSAYQVEGDNHNQWSEWEHVNAEHLALTARQRLGKLANWPEIKDQATKAKNYISANGIEHYERYNVDFILLKKLNMNSFRFGVEWSRIEPIEGEWDDQVIEHYRKYISDLKQLGIEPILTIWHWTMPTWFVAKGGFEKRRNIKYFERFVSKIGMEFGNELRYILILNEPNVYASFSYILGLWPPQKKYVIKTICVYYNLMVAYKRSYALLKSANPALSVGVAIQLVNILPKNEKSIIDKLLAKLADFVWSGWFLNRVKNQLDFIGLNFYFKQTVGFKDIFNLNNLLSSLDGMDPQSLKPVIEKSCQKYKKPILITENGLADATDKNRQWWLETTLGVMEAALNDGVELFGYLHWSLLDNFEWAEGWWPKYGLVAVNRQTMARTIRPSAHWFAKQIKYCRRIS